MRLNPSKVGIVIFTPAPTLTIMSTKVNILKKTKTKINANVENTGAASPFEK